MTAENRSFEAEVSKVLDIVVNSLYSERHIFLRELISNASDACDKLRYAAITNPNMAKGNGEFKIELIPNSDKNTLTIRDNGIGMNKESLISDLGTIARSGSAEFINNLKGDNKDNVSLIGQFGVGFYSVFMVADKIEVRSRRAGDDQGWLWTSDGRSGYSVEEDNNAKSGTEITIFLRDDMKEFADATRIRSIVRTYSDHVNHKIMLVQGEESEAINSASALWTRHKSEINEEQYKEFYRYISHAFDEPWLTLHYRAEGAIEYTALLYVPSQAPFDLFQPDRKPQLNLYVNRVFISNEVKDLIPSYLRFIKGVVDSSDLQLNVSREMLQHNALIAKIKNGVVRRIIDELKKRSSDKEDYKKFWASFGAVLKEGIYEDFERKNDIAKICLFYSSQKEELISLDEYIAEMKEGQKHIYYITGDNVDTLKNNPQLEAFKAKGIDVLLLTDPIDEFWTQALPEFEKKELKSVISSGDELDEIKGEKLERGESAPQEEVSALTIYLKEIFKDELKDVATTERLTSSPACLGTGKDQMSLHLERLMKAHQQKTMFDSARILELNPYHDMIKKMAKIAKEDDKSEKLLNAAWLLLDQAKITEGEPIKDASAFAKRLSSFITDSL